MQSSGRRAARVPRLPPEQHPLPALVPLRDPAGEVGPLVEVGLVRAVVGLPLVVERDRPRNDALALEVAEELVVARLRREGGGPLAAVEVREPALRAPAAEDRLVPPRRRLPRCRRGRRAARDEVVAVPAIAAYASGAPKPITSSGASNSPSTRVWPS